MASVGMLSKRPESMNWDTMEWEFPALFLENPFDEQSQTSKGLEDITFLKPNSALQ